MKVRLLQSISGIDASHNVGDIISVNEAEKARFIKAGIAELIAETKSSKKPKQKFERAVKDV